MYNELSDKIQYYGNCYKSFNKIYEISFDRIFSDLIYLMKKVLGLEDNF